MENNNNNQQQPQSPVQPHLVTKPAVPIPARIPIGEDEAKANCPTAGHALLYNSVRNERARKNAIIEHKTMEEKQNGVQ